MCGHMDRSFASMAHWLEELKQEGTVCCAPALVGNAARGGPGVVFPEGVETMGCLGVHAQGHVVPEMARHLGDKPLFFSERSMCATSWNKYKAIFYAYVTYSYGEIVGARCHQLNQALAPCSPQPAALLQAEGSRAGPGRPPFALRSTNAQLYSDWRHR